MKRRPTQPYATPAGNGLSPSTAQDPGGYMPRAYGDYTKLSNGDGGVADVEYVCACARSFYEDWGANTQYA